MGGKPKPRKPAHREVWLSRNPQGDVVHVWSERPLACMGNSGFQYWWCSIPGTRLGEFMATAIDRVIPFNRPLKVKLRVDVVE